MPKIGDVGVVNKLDTFWLKRHALVPEFFGARNGLQHPGIIKPFRAPKKLPESTRQP